MKRVIAGDGHDSTAAVVAWLQAQRQIRLATLFLIGNPEDPRAVYISDYESDLDYPIVGKFAADTVTRGDVTSKIGLQVASMDVTWSPQPGAFTNNLKTCSPYQLAQLGYYDNWPFRSWTVYMPTPGDANTFGCSQLFGGRVGNSETVRGAIKFTMNSYADVFDQMVPTNVIELSNTAAGYSGAVPPKGFTHIPQFNVITGSSPTTVMGDQTSPDAHSILDTNVAKDGYLVFNYGPNATLGGYWAAIAQNIKQFVGMVAYNQFVLYSALPWTPSTGDTFYVSGQAPIDQADGDYVGFPYVPNPQLAV
jgi:hypothetical protein